MFFSIGLITTIASYAGDDLMEIRSGISQIRKLMNPRNGKNPLPRHIGSADIIYNETEELIFKYQRRNPNAPETSTLWESLERASVISIKKVTTSFN